MKQKNNENSLVVLLETPTQIMNAYELLEHSFFLKKYILVLRENGDELSPKNKKMLNYFGMELDCLIKLKGKEKNILKYFQILKLIMKYRKASNIIVGDVRPVWVKIFLYFYFNTIHIIDDGDITLKVFKNYKNDFFLRNKNIYFFSSFLKESDIVTKNKYMSLRKNIEARKEKDISVFVGSAYSESNVVSFETEIDYIESVVNRTDDLLYFSHPRDSQKKIDNLKSRNINVIQNDLPIELYVLINGYNIKKLYGFYSSALITLSNIYVPKIKVSYKFNISVINKKFIEEVELSYENLRRNNFSVINL